MKKGTSYIYYNLKHRIYVNKYKNGGGMQDMIFLIKKDTTCYFTNL